MIRSWLIIFLFGMVALPQALGREDLPPRELYQIVLDPSQTITVRLGALEALCASSETVAFANGARGADPRAFTGAITLLHESAPVTVQNAITALQARDLFAVVADAALDDSRDKVRAQALRNAAQFDWPHLPTAVMRELSRGSTGPALITAIQIAGEKQYAAAIDRLEGLLPDADFILGQIIVAALSRYSNLPTSLVEPLQNARQRAGAEHQRLQVVHKYLPVARPPSGQVNPAEQMMQEIDGLLAKLKKAQALVPVPASANTNAKKTNSGAITARQEGAVASPAPEALLQSVSAYWLWILGGMLAVATALWWVMGKK